MNPILAGILQGAGFAGSALAQERKESAAQALKQQALDLEREKIYEDPTPYLPIFKAAGLDIAPYLNAGAKMRSSAVPGLLAQAQKQQDYAREEAANRTYAATLRRDNPPVTTMLPDTGTEGAFDLGMPTEPVTAPPALTALPAPLRAAIGLLESGSAGKEGRAEAFKAVLKQQEQQREDEQLRQYGGGGGGANVPPGMSLKVGPATLTSPTPHYGTSETGGAVTVTPSVRGPVVTPIPGVRGQEPGPGREYVDTIRQLQAMEGEVRAGRRSAASLEADPTYQALLTQANRLKIVPLAPGGSLEGAGDITSPFKDKGGPLAQRQPLTTEGEAEKVGLRNSIIVQLERAANIGEAMPQLQDWKGRGSLRLRSWIQGHTPFEQLTPQEQEWVTMHDRLRVHFEQATMGLGPFRSPEMQNQLAEIIGKYWTAGTSTRLRTLANNLRNEATQVQSAQEAGGRRALPAPAPPVTTPKSPAAPGWTIERVK